jgi:hypothetical protein
VVLKSKFINKKNTLNYIFIPPSSGEEYPAMLDPGFFAHEDNFRISLAPANVFVSEVLRS